MPPQLDELSRFSRGDFNVDNLLSQAQRLKDVAQVKHILSKWFDDPPQEFIKLVAAAATDQRINAQVRETMQSAIKVAFRELVRDEVRNRFASALDEKPDVIEDALPERDEVETTQDEMEGS